MKAREKARYARDSAKRKAEANVWYHANRERAKASRRAYYAANPEKFSVWRARREALLREVEHIDYTRSEIFERDGGRCRACQTVLENKPGGFAIDHIVPLALHGPDIPSNLQVMCQPCNRSKWANLEGQIHMPV
ncbi:MAG: HNH endonuclease [Actinomycetota bacterium]|nr:HNH endonuclease [Actinomycetota bacterium]